MVHYNVWNSFYLGVGAKVSGKSAIFSPLKIGGGEGVQPDIGKIETKDRYDK